MSARKPPNLLVSLLKSIALALGFGIAGPVALILGSLGVVDEARIAVIVGAVATALDVLIGVAIGLIAHGRNRRAYRLRTAGRELVAVVLRVEDTRVAVRGEQVMRLTVELPGDGAPRPILVRVPAGQLGTIRGKVALRALPESGYYEVDWHETHALNGIVERRS